MPSSTRELILDAAAELFAEKGFQGTGLRELTARAGVNLAAGHYHFGSKEELYFALLRQHVEPLNAERLRRLDEVMRRTPRGSFREVMAAFIEPVVDLLFEGEAPNVTRLRLTARVHGEDVANAREMERELFAEVRDRFLAAIESFFPTMPPSVVRTRLYYTIGLLMGSLTQFGKLEFITQGEIGAAAFRSMLDDMINFVVSGFAAPLEVAQGDGQ